MTISNIIGYIGCASCIIGIIIIIIRMIMDCNNYNHIDVPNVPKPKLPKPKNKKKLKDYDTERRRKMRKIIPIIFGIAIVLLTSCKYQNGKSMEDQVIYGDSASIGKYDVCLLFEVDDVKVYRFMDHGHDIYFTNCQGKTQYTYQQGAKPPQTRKIECLCNQNYETNN